VIVVIVMIIPMRIALALGPHLGRSSGDAAKHSDGAVAKRLEAWPGGGAHDHPDGEQAKRHQGEEASEERGNG